MKKNVLVFDPHPDDADWWTGGLSILFGEAGWKVHYVCVGPSTQTTKSNALKSAKILGVERHFLEIPINGNPSFADNLSKAVPALVKNLKAEIVFIPPFCDYHREHVTFAREIFRLFHWSSRLGLGDIEVYSYDSHENRHPIEIFIDVSKTWKRQHKALSMHSTFERPGIPDNTLIRIKQGRAQLLGTIIPKEPVEYAEGYRLLQGNRKSISSLPKLFPDKFYFRSSEGILEM